MEKSCSAQIVGISMDIDSAFRTLQRHLQEDPSYAWAWHCNVAMASFDEGMEHKAANRAAARFMSICFGVDVTQFKEYRHIMEAN